MCSLCLFKLSTFLSCIMVHVTKQAYCRYYYVHHQSTEPIITTPTHTKAFFHASWTFFKTENIHLSQCPTQYTVTKHWSHHTHLLCSVLLLSVAGIQLMHAVSDTHLKGCMLDNVSFSFVTTQLYWANMESNNKHKCNTVYATLLWNPWFWLVRIF